MSDGDVAAIAAAADSADDAADALMRTVVEERGLHDDITVVVVDAPPPKEMLRAASKVQPSPSESPGVSGRGRNTAFGVIGSPGPGGSGGSGPGLGLSGPAPHDAHRRVAGGETHRGPHDPPLSPTVRRSLDFSPTLDPIDQSPNPSLTGGSVGLGSGSAARPGRGCDMDAVAERLERADSGAGERANPPIVPEKFDYLQDDITVRRGMLVLDEGGTTPTPWGHRGAAARGAASGVDAATPSEDTSSSGGGGGAGGGVFSRLFRALTCRKRSPVIESSTLHDDYVVGKLLGRGAFGSVRIATLRLGRGDGGVASTTRAVKSIAYDGKSRDNALHEIETMLAVSGRHPCLPTLYHAYKEKARGSKIVHLVLDYYQACSHSY
jgi:hypothetical protein